MEKKAIEVKEEDLQKSNDIIVDEDSVTDNSIVVEEGSESQEIIQVGAWANANDFVKYCVKSSRSAPQILPSNVNSLRRAIAYYDNLEKEIVEGAAADADQAELSMKHLETLDQVEEEVNMVREQLKAAAGRVGILKTAKSAKFVYVVDPFLFAVARLMVNAKVSNGKNIEETFTKMAEKFNINERETFALQQILRDMGYPIHGSFVADEGAYDMIRQYFA